MNKTIENVLVIIALVAFFGGTTGSALLMKNGHLISSHLTSFIGAYILGSIVTYILFRK